ncbi:MAG: vitamin B12 dependent-methionine synthase activation domain-containing protein [Candidatus Marinimicrobia bacterium]|nr:vitamin B12 dependent-methionine synthase activation domain-containing protein [Candidatus Neomarinimicrobiota bacterium]
MQPNPPFFGASPVIRMSAKTLLKDLDKDVLFRAHWKTGKNAEQLLQHLLQDPRVLDSMQPLAVYGYFPVVPEAGGLRVAGKIVWEFPLLKGKRFSDHYMDSSEGCGILALSAVTIGEEVLSLSREYYQRQDYAEYFLLYGLAAELTETLAECVNRKIHRELGIKRSLRRSFGYPACPDLSYQRSLLDLLQAERIHLRLSDANQLIPEFSTTALILPEADPQHEEEKDE